MKTINSLCIKCGLLITRIPSEYDECDECD